MERAEFKDLPESLQKVLDPSKPKVIQMIAKGMAPLPTGTLVSAWCYLAQDPTDTENAAFALQSLTSYPEKTLLPILQSEIDDWVLYFLGQTFHEKENHLEAILLNERTPNSLFVRMAKTCSEKLTMLIANNQERIIEAPEILRSLEQNPNNLKSTTDRLRHFLFLAGIAIPGEAIPVTAIEDENPKAATEAEDSAEETPAGEEIAELGSALTEEQKLSLLQFISKLNIGGRIKLAIKGNREVRQTLIKDANKVVSLAVLKSPKLTDAEVSFYAALKSLSDDVIRTISQNPTWTKAYAVKRGLCFNPKTPIQTSMQLLKFLNVRDLTKLAKEKNIPGPVQKLGKEMLNAKRK